MQAALIFVAILTMAMLLLCGTQPAFTLLAVLAAVSAVCCIVISYILRKRTDEKNAKDAVLQKKIANWRKIRRRESSISVPIAAAKNTAIVFVKMPILEKCCSIEHYGEAKNYHQGSITARAVLTVLRDIAGDSEINRDLQEEIIHACLAVFRHRRTR